MCKILSVLLLISLFSCNSGPGKTSSTKDSTSVNSKSITKYTWQPDEEQEFLSGCVDSAKTKIGDTAAFTQCKCILTQLKQLYPSMDSAAPALMDVNKVAQLAAACK